MLKSVFQPMIAWYVGALKTGGYALVVLLMAIESSIVPLPSELVIPPAAHLAHTGQIPLTVWGVVLAGTIGSWLGASAMYWISRIGGRPLVERHGRLFRITPEKLRRAECWAQQYGSMSIFMSRLLPAVRHVIGIPAGILKMSYFKYSLYTIVGSVISCAVLAYVGVRMGEDEELRKGELHRFTLWIGSGILIMGALYYFFVYRQMKRAKKYPLIREP